MPSSPMSRFSKYKQRKASELGKRMAKRRWELDWTRRKAVAASEILQHSNRVARRIIVVDRERTAREIVIYDFDTKRAARAKIKAVLTA